MSRWGNKDAPARPPLYDNRFDREERPDRAEQQKEKGRYSNVCLLAPPAGSRSVTSNLLSPFPYLPVDRSYLMTNSSTSPSFSGDAPLWKLRAKKEAD